MNRRPRALCIERRRKGRRSGKNDGEKRHSRPSADSYLSDHKAPLYDKRIRVARALLCPLRSIRKWIVAESSLLKLWFCGEIGGLKEEGCLLLSPLPSPLFPTNRQGASDAV